LLINWKRGGLAEAPVPEARVPAPEVPVPVHVPPVPGLAQAAAAAAEAALWAPESGMFSGEARLAHQADPLQARGRDHHRRHHQATHDRAGPQVEVPVQDLRVLGRVQARTVSGVRRPPGQPKPTLGAATPPQGRPQWWVQPWEDRGQPTLEAVDLPWEEEVSSSRGQREGVLHWVGEALCHPDQATVVQAWWVLV